MIDFTFIKETHEYKLASGERCLSTSDIISLNGLSDFSGVPLANLEKARWKGDALHRAVHFYHEDDLDVRDIPTEVLPYFKAYIIFLGERQYQPEPRFEEAMVYRHSSGLYVGCTIDSRGILDSRHTILDLKTSYPRSGKAQKQLELRWRMQLASYAWPECMNDTPPSGAILHLTKEATYKLYDYSPTLWADIATWDAMVEVAKVKLENGFKIERS